MKTGSTLLLLVLVTFLTSSIDADIYLHNPRGSNNRLDGNNRNRQNANRLFDSQNNDRGGYNVGSLYYYTGSTVQIEWTNQHSCGDPNNHCELIIQYMCEDYVRDGAVTTTIPDNNEKCANNDCNKDLEYGMQEDYDYYYRCRYTPRNEGLFTADQNLKGDTAKYTRQNPKGDRYGYECPEERDYYPYWRPSPWKDIAVMTNNASRCIYYQEESENVKSRWACVLPTEYLENEPNPVFFNYKEECEDFYYPAKNVPNAIRGEWREFPSHKLAAPDCRETEWSRDNHLGNGISGYPNLYNWTVPDAAHQFCVLRLRYNISTAEFDGWDSSVNSLLNAEGNENTKVDTYSRFGLTEDEAEVRGYIFENNPQVQIFEDVDVDFQLAVNTAQYGRVFQDRSHSFAIRKRSSNLEGASIHNLNVRGKRGNIVQVYPAVEYDFVPNTLQITPGEYVHFQWTGSNTNPDNNDGQGLAGTDRSNVALLMDAVYEEAGNEYYEPYSKYGQFGSNFPMHLDNATFLGFSRDDLTNLAVLQDNQFRGEMSELDDAGTYFDLGPKKITETGHFHYMCTRNNNFSNRSQKGRIVSLEELIMHTVIGWTGGTVSIGDTETAVHFEQGDLSQLTQLTLERWSPEQGAAILASYDKKMSLGDSYASDYVVVHPQEKFTAEGQTFTLTISLDYDLMDEVKVYRSVDDMFTSWVSVPAKQQGATITVEADQGGVYVARSSANYGIIIGICVAALLLIVIVIGTTIYCRKNPDKWKSFKSSANVLKKSTQNKV